MRNATFSGYYFYMNTNIQGDFQICISVSLTFVVRKKWIVLLVIWSKQFTEFSIDKTKSSEPKIFQKVVIHEMQAEKIHEMYLHAISQVFWKGLPHLVINMPYFSRHFKNIYFLKKLAFPHQHIKHLFTISIFEQCFIIATIVS